MLENIIWFWNLVHYNVFVWSNKVTYFFSAPLFKLLGTSTIKNFYAKRGVSNPDEIIRDALTNSNRGSNIVKAGGIMGALLLLICISIFQFYTGLFDTKINTNPIQLVIYGLIIIPINYFTLFKQKRYLKYFQEFINLSQDKKRKYSWLSFGFILLVLSFLIGSFAFMIHMFHHKN